MRSGAEWRRSQLSLLRGRADERMSAVVAGTRSRGWAVEESDLCQQLQQSVAATWGGPGRKWWWRLWQAAAWRGRERRRVLVPPRVGEKGCGFCLHTIFKETLSSPKAPQPMRCADVQGMNTLIGCLMCLSQTSQHCLP